MEWFFWILSAFGACSIVFLLKIVTVIWWKPLQVKKFFESQGIKGPPYRLLYGNGGDVRRMFREALSTPMPAWSHDIVPRVFPHVHHWNKIYGEFYIYWAGPKARLIVRDLELMKEILSNKLGLYEPADLDPISGQLLRQGLVGLKGEKWLQHRRIINPAFHVDALKGMVPIIVESATNMLEELSKLVLSGQEEFDMFKEFRKTSASVISRTAFGSNYEEGKNIFDMQDQQMILTAEMVSGFYLPGLRFIPTKKNRQLWKMQKEIERGVLKLIESRERIVAIENSRSYGNDLLGIMMTPKKQQVGGKMQDVRLTKEEIVAECKTMYLAGHETASNLMTWAILLLGMHQDWQVQGRREVLEVFGKDCCPNVDGLNRLKIVGMILNETMRLYPAAVSVLRQSDKPVKLGRLSIPAGTQLMIPILPTHHDLALWGNDANEFNPKRFSEGIGKAAKHPLAFTPFGFGPRICVGRDFALLEAKLILAMFLQRFSFVTSPSYTHAPTYLFTLRPQHGAQVILKMIN